MRLRGGFGGQVGGSGGQVGGSRGQEEAVGFNKGIFRVAREVWGGKKEAQLWR